MKRAILTAGFAVGLLTLFAACGGGGNNNSPATAPYNACTTPGYVQTSCGCQNQATLPSGCTVTGYNNGYGFNGGYPGGSPGFAYNPNFGNPGGAIVPGYTTPYTVPPCAYANRCFYYAPQNYYSGAYYYPQAGGYYQRSPGWQFYVGFSF